MQPHPVNWPPAWAAAGGGPGPRSPGAGFPPARWPSRDQLEYVRALITALLLVLALPWLSYMLVTRPGVVLRGAGQRHLKPA